MTVKSRARAEEPKIMKEIHAIRAKHYEATKHLSAEEYVQLVHDEVKWIMEKHNLKIEFSDKH